VFAYLLDIKHLYILSGIQNVLV